MGKPPVNPTVGHAWQRPALTRDVRGLLAVVAHPDDESFGLGALIDAVLMSASTIVVALNAQLLRGVHLSPAN